MRVLYLVQTYRGPAQIRRLVRTIKRSSPDALVLISHNPEEFPLENEDFSGVPDVNVLSTQRMARGDDSLLREYLTALRWAFEHELPFDWVVNLTGQCYPARPLREFEDLLGRGDCDGYLDWWDPFRPSPDNPWGPRETALRYNYRYRRLSTRAVPAGIRAAASVPRRTFNTMQPFVKVETSYGIQVGVRARHRPHHDDGLRLYGGSFFKTLSRRAAHYLDDYGQEHPEVLEYYRHTLLPEEVYPQTVLLNSPLSFVNDSLFYINWAGTRHGHPMDVTTADLEAIASQQAYFARKVNPAVDTAVLDRLDERLFDDKAACENLIAPRSESGRSVRSAAGSWSATARTAARD